MGCRGWRRIGIDRETLRFCSLRLIIAYLGRGTRSEPAEIMATGAKASAALCRRTGERNRLIGQLPNVQPVANCADRILIAETEGVRSTARSGLRVRNALDMFRNSADAYQSGREAVRHSRSVAWQPHRYSRG